MQQQNALRVRRLHVERGSRDEVKEPRCRPGEEHAGVPMVHRGVDLARHMSSTHDGHVQVLQPFATSVERIRDVLAPRTIRRPWKAQ